MTARLRKPLDDELRRGRYLAVLIWVVIFVLGLLAGLAWSTPAQAQTVAVDAAKVTWVNATLLTDGSPVPATGDNAIKETQVQRSVCNADGTFGTNLQQINVPPTILLVLFENLPPAKHCFRARHANNAGLMSNWSVVVSKTTVAPPPPTQKTKPIIITVE